MFFKTSKELVQPDFSTVELDFHGKHYAIFPHLYERKKDGNKTWLEEVPVDNLASEARVQLKRYFMGKYKINQQPPAKKIEDIVDDINLSFEPVRILLRKYPNTISFNSIGGDDKREVPFIINVDLTMLEKFIEDLVA